MRIALLAAALLLIASPTLAQTDAAAPAAGQDAAKKAKPMDDPNRIVCTREHVVGSNRPQKVCMTVAERQRLKDHADRLAGSGARSVADTNAMPTGSSSN